LEKVDAMALEYNYLLTAQLETQRQYFEEKIKEIDNQRKSKLKFLEEDYAQLLEEKLQYANKMKEMEREKKKLQKRTSELEKKIQESTEEASFLKEINAAMHANQEEWHKKIKAAEDKTKESEKDKVIQDLQEQVRDLMLYIEAQKAIANMENSEIKDGSVVVVPSPTSNLTSTPKTNLANRLREARNKKKRNR